MTIEPGATLGPYQLTSRLGAGGMGEVWRASDTRLGRHVAVKVLSAEFRHDLHSKGRFEREARAISQLEHPNICRLYDVGEVRSDTGSSLSYLVMELLEGETLRAKLGTPANGPSRVPPRKALEYAVQLTEGLAAAHDRGIMHRDLKPENIFITREGRVKILDFGLAKPAVEAPAGAAAETAWCDTSPGVLVGTAGYMSPEQIRAGHLDHRSDLFAVGIILFEMVSGHRPFQGRSSVETMNAILTADPPALTDTGSNQPVSPGLDSIIRRLLEKDPHERFQSARDLTFALQAVSMPSGTAVAPAPAAARRGSRLTATVATVVAALTAGALIVTMMTRPRPAAPVSASVRRLTFDAGLEQYPALSPDGKTFAYVSAAEGNADIYLQRVDGRNAINLTKESHVADVQPAFSPDGQQIAFRSSRDGGGIFMMGATGESVRRLTNFGYNPSWSPDGSRIVFSTESVGLNPRSRTPPAYLWTVDLRSGATKQLTRTDAVQPSWSPHGARIAYWGLLHGGGQRDLWTIAADAADPDSTAVAITSDAPLDWNPFWSADGSWLYFGSDRGGSMNLWRIAIDEKTGIARGAAEPVTLPTAFAAHFSAARQANAIIFAGVLQSNAIERYAVEAASPDEQPVTVFNGSLPITGFDVSPEGQRIVFAATNGQQEDLFVMNSDGSHIEQLTNDDAPDRGPAWSGDGKSIYFYSQRGDRYEGYTIHADGGGLTQITRPPAPAIILPRPSPDASRLVAAMGNGSIVWNVHTSQQEPLPTPDAQHAISDARWSPDGRRLVALESPTANVNETTGVVVYDFDTKTYRRVGDDRAYALTWLTNGTIAFATARGLTVVDLAGGKRLEMKLATPASGPRSIAASPDGNYVYVRTLRTNGDVWLATMGERQRW